MNLSVMSLEWERLRDQYLKATSLGRILTIPTSLTFITTFITTLTVIATFVSFPAPLHADVVSKTKRLPHNSLNLPLKSLCKHDIVDY